MATAFLTVFALRLVSGLVADERLALREGADPERLARGLADGLTGRPIHAQLITTVVDFLVNSPLVDELYADDEELSERIRDLGSP